MSGIRRFVVNSSSIRDGYASFNDELHHHIARVLRLRAGDEVLLIDEHGRRHNGVVDQVTQEWTVVRIIATETNSTVSDLLSISVIQGLPRGERIELVLQKGTELGITEFSIFRAARSVPRLSADKLQGRMERWNRITTEAARQSERPDYPKITWYFSASEAAASTDAELKLLLFERGALTPLREVIDSLPRPARIAVAVGPEGGFEPGEVEIFSEFGFIPVTMGKRILRTETAALAMTAILQYKWGDI